VDEDSNNDNLHALCGLQSCRQIVLVDLLLIDVHPRKCIINLVDKARGRSMLAYSVSVRGNNFSSVTATIVELQSLATGLVSANF
jgi:hypothetical protein